ncbi:MAG: hypothetical protein HRT98_02495 [Mycoplasmatales bacterium]|nr:hypothetical protein [Mycoplasmatales bacterium]
MYGGILHSKGITYNKKISGAFLTVDALVTGATITLITFTNISAMSSGSASIYKNIYWKAKKLTKKSRWIDRVAWNITGGFIRPHCSIIISISTTFVTVMSYLFIDRHNSYLWFQSIIFLTITFWTFLGTLTRYCLFNKYPLRTTSKFLLEYYCQKVVKDKSVIHINKFNNYINFFRATQNFELMIEVLRRFTIDKEMLNVEPLKKSNKDVMSSLDTHGNIFKTVDGKWSNMNFIHPSCVNANKDNSILLLMYNIRSQLEWNEKENWKWEASKRIIVDNLKEQELLIIQKIEYQLFLAARNGEKAIDGDAIQELIKTQKNLKANMVIWTNSILDESSEEERQADLDIIKENSNADWMKKTIEVDLKE